MASQLLSQTISAPWGGYDSTTPDAQMPANKCRVLKNLLPGRGGRVTLRGPILRPIHTDSASATQATTWSGGWSFDDRMLHADMRTNPVGYMVTQWDSVAPTLSAKVNPVGLNIGLYPFHTRAGDFVYGYTAGGAGTSGSITPDRRFSPGQVTSDAVAQLLSWNGGSAVGDFVPYTFNRHPRGGIDIKNFLNRLWVLGGSVPGTAAPVYRNRLYYTGDLGDGTVALPDTVAAWQTGGITNQIQLEGSEDDYGVAISILNGRMIILRRQSIYMLTGTNPANFLLRKISSVGCVDPGSVQEWDDGIYFLTDTGMVFFDGTTVRPISAPIQDDLLTATYQGQVANGATELSVSRISSEHFMMVPIRHGTPTVGKSWIYHVPTQSWCEFTANTNVLNNNTVGIPQRILRVNNYALVYDGTYIYDASFVAIPETVDVTKAGHEHSNRTGLEYLIPAHMLSRKVRLTAPQNKSELHTMFLDYILQGPPLVTTGALSWTVSYLNEAGTTIATFSWSGDYSPVGVQVRVHPITHSEVEMGTFEILEQLQVDWTLTQSGAAWPVFAEIYDATVQYQPGEQRDS